MSDFEQLLEPRESILANFSALAEEAVEGSALRLCEMVSFADEISAALLSLMKMEVTAADALLLVKDAVGSMLSEISKIENESAFQRKEIGWQMKNLTSQDGALLVRALLERIEAAGVRLCEEDFVGTEDILPIYAYVKNALADEAYEVITENVPDARVRYVSTFGEGTKLLLAGEVGYCLFPIEEKGDMRLPTVENLLNSARLSIHRIIPVFGLDGLSELKYALVSKGVRVEPYQKDDDRYLEFNFESCDDSHGLSALLWAVELFGLSLYRIHTVAYERNGKRGDSYTLVVRSQGGDFLPLIVYLMMFFDTYRIIGIYKNLEA